MEDIERVVSKNVKKLIKEYNLTHKDLATIAGVSVSTVGKWILEKSTPRMGAIQKISDHFNLPKSYILKEDDYDFSAQIATYPYFPTSISAGTPFTVDGQTEARKIYIPKEVLGKYSYDHNIFFTHINGESMNNIIPDGSLIAIKPTPLERLKNGDIVVYSVDYDYSVKHYYKYGETLVFKPNSTNHEYREQVYDVSRNVKIYGKVITYIVNVD